MQFTKRTGYHDDLRLFPDRQTLWQYLVLFAVLLLLPLAADGYILSQATFVFIYGIVAMGMMLLVGYTGQSRWGTPPSSRSGPMPKPGCSARVFLRAVAAAGGRTHRGHRPGDRPAGHPGIGLYLAMVTLAFAILTEQVIGRWKSVTGGFNGLRSTTRSICSTSIWRPQALLLPVPGSCWCSCWPG
jgi:branched-chain amino acid transport system permease protein